MAFQIGPSYKEKGKNLLGSFSFSNPKVPDAPLLST